MLSVTIAETQATLPELIALLQPGETLVITSNEKPVARLIREEPAKLHHRKAGSAKGMLVIVQDDDEHLVDFAEYLN